MKGLLVTPWETATWIRDLYKTLAENIATCTDPNRKVESEFLEVFSDTDAC